MREIHTTHVTTDMLTKGIENLNRAGSQFLDPRCEVKFDAENHEYTVNGVRMLSVTQLLQKHGIAPDFSAVPKAILQPKAERGTFIHEEIENFIKTGEAGISDEFQDFLRLVYPLADEWWAEETVCHYGYVGRVDLIGFKKDVGHYIIVDTKTGAVHRNAVAWQCAMYARAIPAIYNNTGECFETYCFDAKPNGKSQLIPTDYIPETCINRLMACEVEGKKYSPVEPVATKNMATLLMIEDTINKLQVAFEALEDFRDNIYKQIKNSMEIGHVKEFETPHFKATYVDGYERTCLNSLAIKEEMPEIYNKYKLTSWVKPSLRVKYKEVEDDEV